MAAAFLCDGMVGHVARWLRLMGYATDYAGSRASDAEILERMKPEGPVLVTRDAELGARAKRRGLRVVLVEGADLEDELVSALRGAGERPDPDRWFTRCPHCDGPLRGADRAEVAHAVPARVAELHHEFQRCVRCGHVYWEGTHVGSIEALLERVARRLSDAG